MLVSICLQNYNLDKYIWARKEASEMLIGQPQLKNQSQNEQIQLDLFELLSIQFQSMATTVLVVLLALISTALQTSVLNRVVVTQMAINTVTTYTWQITFDSATNRPNLNLTFPSACTLYLNTTATVLGASTPLSTTFSGNTLIITSGTGLFDYVAITVSNVGNPPSAIVTFSFTVTASATQSFSLAQSNQIIYTPGSLSSASWSFSACTQQAGSNLTVTAVIRNRVTSGTNRFFIGYGNWPELSIKNLLTNVGSLSSLVSFDSGSSYTSTVGTSADTTNQKITITYDQTTDLTVGNTIMFIIIGVQSPPTQTTSSSNFYIATADSAGATIDQSSSLTIANTCVFNLTTGSYSPSSPSVNSNSASPTISFAETPTITIQNSDTVEVYFSPIGNLVDCNTLTIWRNINNPIQATLSTSSSFNTYSITVTTTRNTQYSNNITLALVCTSVVATSSETPAQMLFSFRRSGSQYMQLSTFMTPAATLIPSSRTYIGLSDYQMTSQNVAYTLSIVTSQRLSSAPALRITVPSGVVVPSAPTCGVTLSPGSVLGTPTCLYSSPYLAVNFTAQASLASGTNITLTIQGISNPYSPATLTFGIQTYEFSTVSTSRVEYSTSALSVTYIGISNYPVTFLPASFVVYTDTPTTLSLNTSIEIPSGSTIYVEYPAQASSLSVTSTPLQVNGVTRSAAPTINSNNSYTVTTASAITANSTIMLSAIIKSPSSMASYQYVKIIISFGSTVYLSSTTDIEMVVDSVSGLAATITPSPATAGAKAAYTINMAISVPHPSSFFLQINLPSDVSYSSTGSSCSGNCSSTVTSTNSSFVRVTVTNPSPNTTGFNLTMTLSNTFTNPRAVGNGMLWNLTTSTISPTSTITFTQAYPVITTANNLVAYFLPDSYYINNTNSVKVAFTFSNTPITGDVIYFTVSTSTYQEYTTVTCSGIYGACTKSNLSSPGTLVITITPNLSAISNMTLSLVLEGLISGTSLVDSISVKTENSTGKTIDSGTLTYQISCRDNSNLSILNNCKTCYTNGSCIDCYTSDGFYLNSSICVSDCGIATSYRNYGSNSTGQCTTCTNNCFTCSSATVCITCLSGYYYYTSNRSCLAFCDVNGFISNTNLSGLYCQQCYGSGLCVQCTSSAIGACTLCISSSVLQNGQCLTNCSNSSMYPSGGVCYPCDNSCDTCTAGSNGGCIRCALGYYNFSNFCLSSCPTGTAANITSRLCSCDAPCSQCQGNTTYCTACLNSSLFVSQGQCLTSCPNQTYLSGSTCISCSTACTSCSSTTCFSCLANYYLFNNLCYSDCNLISQQYDVSGTTCVLCPNGCDTCSGTVCSSCLSEYSFSSSSSQCIKTCLLSNSCDLSGQQVLPLPGLIAVVVWTLIVVVIKLILHKNYIPYSLIIFNAVVEFILVLATLSSAPNLVAYSRLLAPSDSQRTAIRGLLGTYIATNYLSNIAYIVIFIKYIRPLMSNPRQIDSISNIVALVIGTITNYRFALIAFAKMFPKPAIHIPNPSKLTPVHYLCIVSIILDILPLVACSLAIYNEQAKTNLYMLGVDLLLIIVLNVIVTIWFVGCKKDDSYYEDEIKKYHLEEGHGTNETMPNEKNISNANMVANQTYHFTQDQGTQYNKDLSHSYKKLQKDNDKITIKSVRDSKDNTANKRNRRATDDSAEESNIIPVRGSQSNNHYDPFSDPNYEVGLKPRESGRYVAPTRDKELGLSHDGNSVDEGLNLKQKSSPKNFSKHIGSQTGPQHRLQDLEEQDDLPDLGQESQNEGRRSVFEKPKEKLSRPKRTGTEKKPKGLASTTNRNLQEPLKIMKKDKKIGYFESDAFESNEEDIEAIIKQKVWQSTIRKQKKESENPASESNNNSQMAYEQISPSWFNIENQRIELSDFDERQSDP